MTIILAVVASSGIWTFITFLLTRKDKQKDYATKEDVKKAVADCATKAEFEDLKKDTTDLKENTELLKLGLQAMLRSELVHDYNKWSEKGYAPIYARENFENNYKRYHSLGANGVMDDLRAKFLLLPTELDANKVEEDKNQK